MPSRYNLPHIDIARLEVCNRKSRYALIVTLRALNPDVDIYTPIRTSIGLPVPVPIEIPV
jgi:hypothetical protein